ESDASIIANHMYVGQFMALKAGEYGIILGTRLANHLGVYVGDKVKLLSAKRSIYTPLGRMPSQRNFTVVGLFELSSEIDGNLALIHRVDAAKLLRQKSNNVPALRLYLNDAFTATDVATSIMPVLHKTLGNELKITTWHQRYGQLFSAVNMEKRMMWLMLSLIIGVAAFNIVSALVILVTEKQTAIAIFATLGLPQSAIAKIFIIQGVINGVLGTIIGLVIGLGLTLYLNDLLSIFGITALANPVDPANGLPILVKPLQIFYLLVATVVVTFLATLYPSYKAGKVNPAEALKHE
ncbi:MAG: FtsX-like permease family protein, partial [Gammaproteobacteria bacterium]|nr:FtsX-like permease family protein [Gammaproteobacteria bacterium]